MSPTVKKANLEKANLKGVYDLCLWKWDIHNKFGDFVFNLLTY